MINYTDYSPCLFNPQYGIKFIDNVCQVFIVVLGLIAILLVARKNKWGFIFGLLSQPFWLITAYINNQWGVLLLSVGYTFSWIYGIYNWFIKDQK
jgi:nicotinamide riboside transporter PnuC